MFGIGMHFPVRDLLPVRTIALPGAVAQIAAASDLGRRAVVHHAESNGLSNGQPLAIRPGRLTSMAAPEVLQEGLVTGVVLLKSLGIGCRKND